MNLQKKADKELVILLINNDEQAFAELYIRYKKKLFAFCFTYLKSADEAEDIVQELFLFIWKSRAFLNPGLSFSSYLYAIARNRVLNYFRNVDIKLKVENILLTRTPQHEEIIESDLVYKEYLLLLKQLIAKLPPQRQRIFNLSREQHLTHKEIAKALKISPHTVQEHISESLRFIKKEFSKNSDLNPYIGFLLYCFLLP